ncbi:hypothetical protein FRB94_007302 [Tulasnella sp. JGI-2019a]|nr:hypothetical protein FRB94_007302 [Tulasnella sp. JGI-2019a]KAG9013294.1 hypothetical protein FRB93_000817 [Tulasnella sp. JGI-2019a]KAG9024215.1 hypothetical protein FRB95_011942 [Tulasnella sp. JGI-2019a]
MSEATATMHEEATEVMTKTAHVTLTSVTHDVTTIDLTAFDTSPVPSTATQVNATPTSPPRHLELAQAIFLRSSVLRQLLPSQPSQYGKESGILWKSTRRGCERSTLSAQPRRRSWSVSGM